MIFVGLQIQHPRTRLDRFDMVITPHHDYYPLTPQGQEKIPRFLRPFVTPREPPGRNVVSCLSLFQLFFMYLRLLEVLDYFNALSKRPICNCCMLWKFCAQVLTVGALHQVDSSALRNAAKVWHDEFAALPRPLLVVNVGGPTSNPHYL